MAADEAAYQRRLREPREAVRLAPREARLAARRFEGSPQEARMAPSEVDA
jgi:hypothetical protein